MTNLNCPNCGNPLVTKGKFCPFCGTSIPEDIYIKIDSKQEILDHAKIEEARVSGQTAKEKEKTKRRRGCLIVVVVLIIAIASIYAMPIMYFVPELNPFSTKHDSLDDSIETMRLTSLEDEILEDIRNERYEQALAKAQTMRYTIDYSQQSRREWDQKRENLIKTLQEILDKE